MTEKDIINALNRMVTNLETCIKAKQILITREKEAEHLLYTTIGAINIINRLKFENERLLQKSQQPQAEAIIEFAERLKNKAHSYFLANLIWVVTIEDIDNLVKEMVGENNG